MGAFDKCKCGHVQGQHMDIAGCEVPGCKCLGFRLVDAEPPPRMVRAMSAERDAELAEYAVLKRVAQAARVAIKGLYHPAARTQNSVRFGLLRDRLEELDALHPERQEATNAH